MSSNISYGVPTGLKVVDDHPLNIIIRQFGAGDQVEDIFTILCSYAGMEAGVGRCFKPGTRESMVLSFISADGRWLVIDAKNGRYFLNDNKRVAGIEDFLGGMVPLSDSDQVAYLPFLAGLKDVDTGLFTRAEEQMPLMRIPAKIKRRLNNK